MDDTNEVYSSEDNWLIRNEVEKSLGTYACNGNMTEAGYRGTSGNMRGYDSTGNRAPQGLGT